MVICIAGSKKLLCARTRTHAHAQIIHSMTKTTTTTDWRWSGEVEFRLMGRERARDRDRVGVAASQHHRRRKTVCRTGVENEYKQIICPARIPRGLPSSASPGRRQCIYRPTYLYTQRPFLRLCICTFVYIYTYISPFATRRRIYSSNNPPVVLCVFLVWLGLSSSSSSSTAKAAVRPLRATTPFAHAAHSNTILYYNALLPYYNILCPRYTNDNNNNIPVYTICITVIISRVFMSIKGRIIISIIMRNVTWWGGTNGLWCIIHIIIYTQTLKRCEFSKEWLRELTSKPNCIMRYRKKFITGEKYPGRKIKIAKNRYN